MPLVIDGQTYYRTSEACQKAGVSRATLFRWLSNGVLDDIANRDRRGWRLFSLNDINRLKSEVGKITAARSRILNISASSSLHVLVVDDEASIGLLFKDVLREPVYKVTVMQSSRKALELISRNHYDLIFLDLVMSEIDGSELFRCIRETDNDVPVIVITGYPDSDLMNRAMEYGPFLVMKKPFDGDDIYKAVHSLVGNINARS